MATEQASLADLHQLVDEPELQPAKYRGGTANVDATRDVADKSVCQHCGEPVSADWRRVCGDSDDVAHACIECAESTQEASRYASYAEFEPGMASGSPGGVRL